MQNVRGTSAGNPGVEISLTGATGQLLGKVQGPSLAKSGNIAETTYRIAASLNSVGISLGALFKTFVSVTNFNVKSGVFASLGHIYDSNGSSSAQIQVARDDLEGFETPDNFVLLENYPNPFNPETTLQYAIPQAGRVTLAIYNLRGEVILSLVNGYRESGHYRVRWDGTDGQGRKVASGVYLSRIQVGDFTTVRKLMLLK